MADKKLKTGSGRNLSFDGWRGIMSLFIMLLHFNNPHLRLNTAYLGVEFFFILSGFLLMKHLESIPQSNPDVLITPQTILMSKVKRFFGLNFFCILLLYTWNFFQQNGRSVSLFFNNFFDHIGEIFFLQCSGLKMELLNIPAWYLSALILSSYLVTALYCWNKKIFLSLACPLLILMSYANISQIVGKLDVFFQPAFGPFTYGLLRGTAGLCVGFLLYTLYDFIKRRHFFKEVLPMKQKYFIGLIDLMNFAVMLRLMILRKPSQRDFLAIPCFCIIILFSALNLGPCAKFASLKPFVLLGHISLEVYLVQWFILQVINYYFSQIPYQLETILFLSSTIFFATIWHFAVEPLFRNICNSVKVYFAFSVKPAA